MLIALEMHLIERVSVFIQFPWKVTQPFQICSAHTDYDNTWYVSQCGKFI